MNRPTSPPTGPKASKTEFNWEDAKARLSRSAAAVVDLENVSTEHTRAILDARAKRLARPLPEQPDASETLDLVTFRIDGERFGIEARFVREMIHLEHITPVPDAPEFLLGTTNLRGEVVAVLDVRSFFDAPKSHSKDSHPALILGESRIEFALLTDQVEEVSAFRTIDFFDSTGTISSFGREWVRGITRQGLILLDTRILLNDPRLFVDDA